MKQEIEDDLAHLAFKDAQEASLKATKRRSGVAPFVPSGRSPSPVNRTEQDGSTSPKSTSNPNAAANIILTAIANLKSVAGTTKIVKSKGKGKGKQKFTKMDLGDDHYDYSRDDYEYDEDEKSEDEESEDEESEDEESEDEESEDEESEDEESEDEASEDDGEVSLDSTNYN
jgi:hypothetical protein